MSGNIQHSTFNFQYPARSRVRAAVGVFLPLTVIARAVRAQTSNALPPLAPAYPEIKPGYWEQHGTGISVFCLALVALVVVVIWLIFRPRPRSTVPMEVVARAALESFQGQPETVEVLAEISSILRHYLVLAIGLPPGERTTGELSAEMARDGRFGPELTRAASEFLAECDQRKFSAAHLDPPLDAASRALQIFVELEKRRQPISVQ